MKLARRTLTLTFALGAMIGSALAQETIRIGFVGPLSGPAAHDGSSTLAAAQVAVQEINAAGGVLNRKIELLTGDSRGIPAEAINAYKKLVVQDKVVSMICCWFSTSTIATMPTMDELKIPTVCGVSFLPDAKTTKLTWLFKFAHTPSVERRYVDYWVSTLGVKKVAFLARNDDWGRSNIQAWHERLKELGGEVLSTDFYTPGERDFYAYLNKIKALNPDAIAFVDVSGPSATIVKQMGEVGIKAKRIGSDGAVTDAFIRIGGHAVEGVPIVTRYSEMFPSERNQKFAKAFAALRKGDIPDNYSQPGYEAIHILAEAIRRAGSTDPDKIREQLAKTDYVTLSESRIRFDQRQQAIPKIFLAVIKNGKREIIQELDTSGLPY